MTYFHRRNPYTGNLDTVYASDAAHAKSLFDAIANPPIIQNDDAPHMSPADQMALYLNECDKLDLIAQAQAAPTPETQAA